MPLGLSVPHTASYRKVGPPGPAQSHRHRRGAMSAAGFEHAPLGPLTQTASDSGGLGAEECACSLPRRHSGAAGAGASSVALLRCLRRPAGGKRLTGLLGKGLLRRTRVVFEMWAGARF